MTSIFIYGTTAQIASLTTKQIRALSTEDIQALSTDLLAVLTSEQIRALEIFPKSKIQIGENLLIVNSAKVVNENPNNSPLTIKFSDEKFLQIEKITAPSGKQMSAESYINGYLK